VGYAHVGPSLPVTPLVQDDDSKRGGLCVAQLWALGDPLPTGHLKRENKAEIEPDSTSEKRKK
jgi:hypothetical protein